DAADTADVPPPPCPSGEWGDLIFEFQADDTIVSTPAIGDDGTIYFGTQSATLYAVDCFGNKKWEWPMDCGDFCPQAFEGSPAIGGDGTIYIGDDIAVPNYAFALSPGGDMLWRYETHVVYGQMDASPVIASDGTIFFGAHGDSGYVGPIGQLVALDTDGNVYDGFPMETKAIRRNTGNAATVIRD
ncbi:MAG: PQQ-binding-like beta-propeller repeat protein, partial [Pseudomonadota bacterium]